MLALRASDYNDNKMGDKKGAANLSKKKWMSNMKMDKFNHNRKIFNFIMMYYRAIGMPFGGISFEGQEIKTNSALKVYGYVMAVVITLINLVNFYLFIIDPHFKRMLGNKGIVVYSVYLLYGLLSTEVIVNVWFLQVKGTKMLRIMTIFMIKDKRWRISLFLVWFATSILPIIYLCYELATQEFSDLDMITRIFNKILQIPASWAQCFITWIISISVYNHLKILRKTLTVAENRRSVVISMVRKSFVETREIIVDMDNCLAMVQIISTITTITGIMIQIYLISMMNKEFQEHNQDLILFMVSSTIKLICNCFINGLLHDESEKLLSSLDDIDMSKLMDEPTYRETILFMSINRNLKYGFTIAEFMPLKRTTLMTMFSFILTYSVILIQTGSQS